MKHAYALVFLLTLAACEPLVNALDRLQDTLDTAPRLAYARNIVSQTSGETAIVTFGGLINDAVLPNRQIRPLGQINHQVTAFYPNVDGSYFALDVTELSFNGAEIDPHVVILSDAGRRAFGATDTAFGLPETCRAAYETDVETRLLSDAMDVAAQNNWGFRGLTVTPVTSGSQDLQPMDLRVDQWEDPERLVLRLVHGMTYEAIADFQNADGLPETQQFDGETEFKTFYAGLEKQGQDFVPKDCSLSPPARVTQPLAPGAFVVSNGLVTQNGQTVKLANGQNLRADFVAGPYSAP